MDLLGERLAAQHHVIHGAELRALGTTYSELRRLLADGVLVRVRRDCFVSGEVWRAAPPWERHQLRARAVATGLCGPGRPFALSHHSSLAVQEIGSFGVDDRVHLVRTDRRRGRSDDVVHVHPPVDAGWVVGQRADSAREDSIVDGDPPVTDVALACLQVTGSFGLVPGLVSTDIALRLELTTMERLREAQREGSFGHGAPAVRTVLEQATALSGSAGETRCRWIMATSGLPAPELQARICDERGDLIGYVDFLLRDAWTIVEFDGAVKYGSPADLMAEKRREDRLRALGYEVVRVTWDDLAHPERVVGRIRAAMARGRGRHTPSA